MNAILSLIDQLQQGDTKALARAITIVENELTGSRELLEKLSIRKIPVIGITGPPGAGKSSLINVILRKLLKQYHIGVVAVDPTSPFNFGSLLGDRIRLAEHFNDPNLFMRSMATRGSLGGLSEKITEVTDVMRAFPFDYIFIETVGVGQSEVEIAGLADTTVVVMVPEGGDEIQTMKAGVMEIADIFVVNKSDHAEADHFLKHLRTLAVSKMNEAWEVPVLKTVAVTGEGIEELISQVQLHYKANITNERSLILNAEKIWRIIQKDRMRDIDKIMLRKELEKNISKAGFNIYRFAKTYAQ